jgi:hypothetical protein
MTWNNIDEHMTWNNIDEHMSSIVIALIISTDVGGRNLTTSTDID